MFETPPEKPSVFATRWIVICGIVGGVPGLAVGFWLFPRALQESETAMLASFMAGAIVGVAAGWKLVMPAKRPPSA